MLIGFLPLLLFVSLYVGSGIYFSSLGIPNAFYQLPATIALLPAIALGWRLYKGTTQERMQSFLNGVRHPDIITMCLIFLLAGAFSAVTKSIGSVDAAVNLALSFIPPPFLLGGVFLTAAFIATAIGTSMGTIATVAPVAVGLANQGAFDVTVGVATVVGGAMFGDNLSLISDTTIAAVMSQEADFKAKLRLNLKVAAVAACITLLLLVTLQEKGAAFELKSSSPLLVLPYIFLIGLACWGVNVFITLFLALCGAALMGYWHSGYTFFALSHDMTRGFASMHEIMLLSLMVGGLSGLVGKNTKAFALALSHAIEKKGNAKIAQLVIAKIVSVFDILFANNTIAIIFSGEFAREIAKSCRVPAHYSATWLDIFSCVWQGIIPYGAQVLLASSLAGISPLSITPHVYYCYIVGAVAIGFILWKKIDD